MSEQNELISGWYRRLSDALGSLALGKGDERTAALQVVGEVVDEMRDHLKGNPIEVAIMPRFYNALLGVWGRWKDARSEAITVAKSKLRDPDAIKMLDAAHKDFREVESIFSPVDQLQEAEEWYRRKYPDSDPAKEYDL